MQLTTGQRADQTEIDIDGLIRDLATDTIYKIFVDTIDESNDVFVDEGILVVHIARSEYNATQDKQQLVKRRVEEALQAFDPEPSI